MTAKTPFGAFFLEKKFGEGRSDSGTWDERIVDKIGKSHQI